MAGTKSCAPNFLPNLYGQKFETPQFYLFLCTGRQQQEITNVHKSAEIPAHHYNFGNLHIAVVSLNLSALVHICGLLLLLPVQRKGVILETPLDGDPPVLY